MQGQELNFKDVLMIISGRKKVIVYVVVFSLICTFLMLSLITPKYKSEVTLLVGGLPQVESPFYASISTMRMVDVATTISEVISSRDNIREVVIMLGLEVRTDKKEFESPVKKFLVVVKDAVTDKLGLIKGKMGLGGDEKDLVETSIEKLSKNVKVESVERTDVIKVIAYDYNPEMAAKIADKLTKVYLYFSLKQQSLEMKAKYGDKYPKMVQIQKELSDTKQALTSNDLGFGDTWNKGNVKVISQAYVPTKPANIRKSISYALSLILSLILGVVLVFFLELFDHSSHKKDR